MDEIVAELLEQGFHASYDTLERTFRKEKEEYNKKYREHLTNGYYVAHSNKDGYRLTTDHEEIKSSLVDNHKRAITMLVEESKVRKAMGEDINVFANEIIEQLKKTQCE
jgi:DNA-binding ferritin-like protein (Dps family)